MLKAYNRVDIVRKGDFWNLFACEWADLGRADLCRRIPRPLMIIIGPLIGFVYALTLPIIGIAIMIALFSSKLIGKVGEVAWTAASFSWRPTESYLAGKRAGSKGRRWR